MVGDDDDDDGRVVKDVVRGARSLTHPQRLCSAEEIPPMSLAIHCLTSTRIGTADQKRRSDPMPSFPSEMSFLHCAFTRVRSHYLPAASHAKEQFTPSCRVDAYDASRLSKRRLQRRSSPRTFSKEIKPPRRRDNRVDVRTHFPHPFALGAAHPHIEDLSIRDVFNIFPQRGRHIALDEPRAKRA